MTIYVVTKSEDLFEGEPLTTLLRAFKTSDAAKGYIETLTEHYLVDYDWEAVEMDDDE